MSTKTKIHIIYPNYLAKNGKGMSVGGIQTYLSNLINLIKDKGIGVSLYQTADYDFHTNVDGLDVYACKLQKGADVSQVLYEKCKEYLQEDDIIIFGTDFQIIKTECKRVIGIQHGISWDIPTYEIGNGKFAYFKSFCRKALNTWRRNKCLQNANKVVCVDHNFVNWYRAVVPFPQTNFTVIPNFTDIPKEREYVDKEDVRIIFARRFFTYRGTRLFANVIERILKKHNNVYVTFAGEGPDEEYIRNKFNGNDKVTITKYNSNESLEIHKKHDIAIVPTVGSEGTSLSLLEAMASGCAVVCSNVGGMTNIILDGFNGIMFDPYNEDDLYYAIKRLVKDKNERNRIAKNGYTTTCESFSLQIWRERWSKVIDDIIKQ